MAHTPEQLARLSTKEDLQGYATKQELTDAKEEILTAINGFAQEVQRQFGTMQEQMTSLHSRMDSIEQRLDRLEKILEAVQRQVDELRGDLTAHKSDVLKLIEYLETELARIKQEIGLVS